MFTVTICWGEYPDPHNTGAKTYAFDTQAELDAFMYGIDRAIGWLDYWVVTDEHV